jgi:hypothetical protein
MAGLFLCAVANAGLLASSLHRRLALPASCAEVRLFQLTLVEHVHLSLNSVAAAFDDHATAAVRLARHWWYARALTLAVAAAAAVLAGIALQQGRGFQIAATVAATAALAACAAYVAFDPSARILAHRTAAARLWLLCENYRALLAEIHDGLIDAPAIRERRGALAREVAAILEQSPPAPHHAFELASAPAGGTQPAAPPEPASAS